MKISIINIITLISSLSAVISVLYLLFKVRNENKKLLAEIKNTDSNTDKSYVETYKLLHDQLKESYDEIKELRTNQETIICHREYEEYLIRCIRILTARLVSLSVEVPCTTTTFKEFMIEKEKTNGTEQ